MLYRTFIGRLCCCLLLAASSLHAFAQANPSWFIDGYHGGIWGHYPQGYTRFIVDQLNKYPHWNINLEIEPVTWDAVRQNDTGGYRALQVLMADTSINRRIEYVNPAYGQPYFYNISGESIIRQFQYGIKKLRQHFPAITFSSYSSEEPCFTSALPQVLKSFGVRYASLKNPNTCWGGYTRAHGGELVNWIGPDGSSLRTVPRYATEGLEKRSTWQTNAWGNSPAFLQAARDYGIQHPVGMCLQDAGWHNGPWLGIKPERQVTYTTWQQYFEQVADHALATNWKVSQEDIQVSLVWGAQVLQRIAQQVRVAENKLIAAEKLAAMATLKGFEWPQAVLDSAWCNLLLAQHHDCWIVPYNRGQGSTWIEKVAHWTATTNKLCDSITAQAMRVLNAEATNRPSFVRIFNTATYNRNELMAVDVSSVDSTPQQYGMAAQPHKPGKNKPSSFIRSVQAPSGERFPVQWSAADSGGRQQLLFKAQAPGIGYSTYTFSNKASAYKGAAIQRKQGKYILETDLYQLTIDPAAGGAITSLIGRQQGNRQWIDNKQHYSFNQLGGNFFTAGGQHSTTDTAAAVTILENGPLRIRVRIRTQLAGHAVLQELTLVQGEPRIDAELRIDWKSNTGIGDSYNHEHPLKAEEYRKSFYNDREKLLLLFPVSIQQPDIYKNAPYDVTKSAHDHTFFKTWDSIKNNVILHWVDVADKKGAYGMAIFTDHTSAYVQGDGMPAGLVVQYSGKGLWGMNYTVQGSTIMRYAWLPHTGNWEGAQLESERERWTAPLLASVVQSSTISTEAQVASVLTKNNFLEFDKPGWEVSAITTQGPDWLVRVYHASATDTTVQLIVRGDVKKVTVEELNGKEKLTLVSTPASDKAGNPVTIVRLTAPRFGIRTIRLHNIIQQQTP